MTPRLIRMTPFLPTNGSVQESIDFYRDKLGFEVLRVNGTPPTFATMARDEVHLDLTGFNDRQFAENLALRVQVEEVDALHAQFLANGLGMVNTRDGFMNPVQDKPWGTREFGVIDPAGVCITFYELK